MKKGGMRGGEIWDVAAYADPDGRVPAGPAFLGPGSTRLMAHAIREADRLGLEIGMIASSGWNAGGSWIAPQHAGKGIYQSITTVTGPVGFHAELPLPELPKLCPRDAHGRPIYLREVAVLAVPRDKSKSLADLNQVVDLTKRIEADGKLRWEVPVGDWDILRFVCANHGQQLIDSHYVTARKVLGSYGLKLIAESGGPGPPIWDSNPVDGIKTLGVVDIPRGEFGNRHRGILLIKEIASAAHVYDKRLVSAESFTTWGWLGCRPTGSNLPERFAPARINWRSGSRTCGPTGSMGIRCGPSQLASREATLIGFKPIRHRTAPMGGFPLARRGPFTPVSRRSCRQAFSGRFRLSRLETNLRTRHRLEARWLAGTGHVRGQLPPLRQGSQQFTVSVMAHVIRQNEDNVGRG